MGDLECNTCGTELSWGDEYQLPTGSDFDALCSECHHSNGTTEAEDR